MRERDNREITYDIKEKIGVIKTFNSGWRKELNVVAWNGGNPKYDIRDWDMDYKHMTKGITMYPDEMAALAELLKSRDFKAEAESLPEKE